MSNRAQEVVVARAAIAIDDCTPEQLEEDDRQWESWYASHQEQFARMADEALADFNAGRTEPLDLDNL